MALLLLYGMGHLCDTCFPYRSRFHLAETRESRSVPYHELHRIFVLLLVSCKLPSCCLIFSFLDCVGLNRLSRVAFSVVMGELLLGIRSLDWTGTKVDEWH